jgi:hypothetical protein
MHGNLARLIASGRMRTRRRAAEAASAAYSDAASRLLQTLSTRSPVKVCNFKTTGVSRYNTGLRVTPEPFAALARSDHTG